MFRSFVSADGTQPEEPCSGAARHSKTRYTIMSSGSFTSKTVATVLVRWHGKVTQFTASRSTKHQNQHGLASNCVPQRPSGQKCVLAYAVCHLDGSARRRLPRCGSGKQAYLIQSTYAGAFCQASVTFGRNLIKPCAFRKKLNGFHTWLTTKECPLLLT